MRSQFLQSSNNTSVINTGHHTYTTYTTKSKTQRLEDDDRAALVEKSTIFADNVSTWKQILHRRYWKPLWHHTIEDIKYAPWRWAWFRLCTHILPVFVITSLGVILWVLSLPNILDRHGSLCTPGGSFYFGPLDYSPWRGENVFSVNMLIPGKSFHFGIAKMIDIIWDIIVGRGGQAILAIVGYQVITMALVRSMESAPVSQDTYKALCLRDNSLSTLASLTANFLTNRGIRARLAMFWIMIAAIFILLIPTWLSAMTGYTADMQPYIEGSDGDLVSPVEFLPIIYTIHDGHRLGLDDEYPVVAEWSQSGPTLPRGSSSPNFYGCFTGRYTPSPTNSSCAWLWRISHYTSIWGFLGYNKNASSSFVYPNGTTIKLQRPTLNISASFYTDDLWKNVRAAASPWDADVNGINYESDGKFIFRTNNPEFLHRDTSIRLSLAEFNERGICSQTNDVKYRWGFSFLLTYLFVVALLVWTVIMYTMYLDTYLNSRLHANGFHPGLERAVMDLSQAMRTKLYGEDSAMYTNQKLKKLVRRAEVTYTDFPYHDLVPTRKVRLVEWWKEFKIWPWLKAEKWWLALLLIFTLLCILGAAGQWPFWYIWFPYCSAFPIIGVILVVSSGRQVRSRWLLFAFWFVLFLVFNIWFIVRIQGKPRFRHFNHGHFLGPHGLFRLLFVL